LTFYTLTINILPCFRLGLQYYKQTKYITNIKKFKLNNKTSSLLDIFKCPYLHQHFYIWYYIMLIIYVKICIFAAKIFQILFKVIQNQQYLVIDKLLKYNLIYIFLIFTVDTFKSINWYNCTCNTILNLNRSFNFMFSLKNYFFLTKRTKANFTELWQCCCLQPGTNSYFDYSWL